MYYSQVKDKTTTRIKHETILSANPLNHIKHIYDFCMVRPSKI